MRYSRRYIAFTLVLALLCGLKFTDSVDQGSQVGNYQNVRQEVSAFYPMRAAQINSSRSIKASLDGENINGAFRNILVDEQMELMVSSSLVPELFGAHLSVHEDGRVSYQRGKSSASLFKDSLEATYNKKKVKLSHAPVFERGVCFLPLQDLANWCGYKVDWDLDARTVNISSQGNSKVILPTRFDLRDEEMVSQIRDQGSASECWADAAIGALESSLLPQTKEQYSVTDMVNNNAFGLDSRLGGDYEMAASYLLSWKGPKKTSDDRLDRHVQGVRFPDQNSLSDIKKAVYERGGMTSSLYVDIADADISSASFYSKESNSYCYTGKNRPNHDVIIVGWDDNYKAENFKGNAKEDGAWICQNSWGKDFGESGVFYVSYEDTTIGSQAASYADVEDSDNFKEIYQSDLAGWIGQVGYGSGKIAAANFYTAREDSQVEAAGFYALGKNTRYQVSFVSNIRGSGGLNNRVQVASGLLQDRGFYTIRFDSPKEVGANCKFAVVVELDTPGATQPMAIEYRTGDSRTANIDLKDGEGYISKDGSQWESTEKKISANLCLKAYSNPAARRDQ